MRRPWWVGVGLLTAVLAAGSAYADSPPATSEGTVPAPGTQPEGEVPLALSIRALSLGQPSLTDTGDMERVRASTGAGTSRWPSASTQVGRGVYISVMPACIPGIDEPLRPATPRRRR